MEPSEDAEILDSETRGFDPSTGETWIYPENYPIRHYQFSIVQTCLYKNTLVCLPTGLGKTFIAAVVMYNFWRWYPHGKIIFLAPTRPLVTQQILACYNIMGIPSAEAIELTGAVNQKERSSAWVEKRVIFATPQVFHNDLERNIVPADLVKCVVIDEAHKALGKHSYCECIRLLTEKNQYFRIVALSATPGNKMDNVHEVVQNLHIARMELRDETSCDVMPFINQRKVDIIVVPLKNELVQYRERFTCIMDRHIKVLLQCKVLSGQTGNISKGVVFHLLQEYQKQRDQSRRNPTVVKTLSILMTMYHAYDLMVRTGLRAFHKFFQNHSDKFWMNGEIQLQELLTDIEQYLGPFPEIKSVSAEALTNIPQNLVFGHTKFGKLKELLLDHFTKNIGNENSTRAIVFVEYRDIVSEIYVLLSQCQPLIRPQMFVGQTGQKQKQQLKALTNFRNNDVNVLISTSIGEEGLDVGEVDLIICFDISQRSPTRLVQRMGRTGRKRDGHIIILVTDGKEHETLKSAISKRESLNNKILNTSNISSSLYQKNSRMIPDTFKPKCLKMHITVQPITQVKAKNKGSNKKSNKRLGTLKESVNRETHKNEASSMMKFLKNDKDKEQAADTLHTLSSNVSQINKAVAVQPFDVKIFSCDNDAVDFLTLCALRDSIMRTNTDDKRNTIKTYLPTKISSNKDVLTFTIPDIKVLDCLSTLNDVIIEKHAESKSSNRNNVENKENNKNGCNNDTRVLNNSLDEMLENNESNNNSCNNNTDVLNNSLDETLENDFPNRSRFEDLLDTTDTSESDTEKTNEQVCENTDTYFNYDSKNLSKQYTEQHSKISVAAVIETERLEDLKPGIFESLLSESSDESNHSFVVKHAPLEISVENTDASDNMKAHTLNSTQLRSETIEADNIMIRSDSSKHGIQNHNCESNGGSSKICESKYQNTFSITQAINEIARRNLDTNISNAVGNSEDDIFQENDEKVDINNETTYDCIIAGMINNNKSYNENIKNGNNELNTELENVEEFDWNDEFTISAGPVENCFDLNSSNEKILNRSNDVLSGLESDSSPESWISVEKSANTPRKSETSISKKLASLSKRCDDTKGNLEKKRCSEKEVSFVRKHRNVSLENEEEATPLIRKNCNVSFGNEEDVTEVRNNRGNGNHNSGRVNVREFINDEASVSCNASEDESSGTGEDLSGFISNTQSVHDTSDMHAHYLQTVRSPIKRTNTFLFKKPQKVIPKTELYSQAVSDEDSHYVNDSFCVDEEEEDVLDSSRTSEISILELAERKLVERRKRKRAREYKIRRNCKRRRNVMASDSTSSEDEVEKMRKEIQEG